MIIFLTLCYIGVIALLVKWGVLRWTLWWKLSPLAWMILLIVVLFIPMQWGAPSGPVTAYQYVIEVIPNVSGEVVDVQAKGLHPMKEGDVLFQIDPEPFQHEVDRLEAALAEAKQNAAMLPSELEAAKARTKASEVGLTDAEQQVLVFEAAFDAAQALVSKTEADLQLARTSLERDSKAAQTTPGAITEEQLDTRRKEVDVQEAALKAAKAAEQQARIVFEAEFAGKKTVIAKAEEQLRAARAAEVKAQLAVDSVIDGVNTNVAQLDAGLRKARFNLEETTVRAPSAGYVVANTLRPGQRVAALPVRSWMAFIDTEKTVLVVGIQQYALRHVKSGQQAEVVLSALPGQTFAATVDRISYTTSEGQMEPTGKLPTDPGQGENLPIGITLKLNDANLKLSDLPGGAVGTAAIYTDRAQATHIIRKVMIRMDSWMNYIIP